MSKNNGVEFSEKDTEQLIQNKNFLNNQNYVISYRKVCDIDRYWTDVLSYKTDSKFSYIDSDTVRKINHGENMTIKVGFTIIGALVFIPILFTSNIEALIGLGLYIGIMLSFFGVFVGIPGYFLNRKHTQAFGTVKRTLHGRTFYKHKSIIIRQ